MVLDRSKRCTIRFKSGDGESFIETVYEYIESMKPVKIELTEDQQQELEDEFSSIIFHHDHGRHTGYGRIVLEPGKVPTCTYQEQED